MRDVSRSSVLGSTLGSVGAGSTVLWALVGTRGPSAAAFFPSRRRLSSEDLHLDPSLSGTLVAVC